jgi:hypothetical protein
MKKTFCIIAFLLLIPSITNFLYAHNPIIQTCYTPDPAPMVYNDTVFLYTGHDEDGSTWFTMNDWHVYSSTDMVNWTDRGTPLSLETFAWADKNAWASQCVERNGKFYWYICAEGPGTGMAIGVAVSDSPSGPFVDAIGHPLCQGGWGYIDPTVFIDDDGQAYLYWGNPGIFYAKLNEDMISYSGGIVEITQTAANFGGPKEPQEGVTYTDLYEEGPWLYKRNGNYYLLYAAGGVPEHISYSMSDSPTGQWEYKGKIMPLQDTRSFTNHCGVIDFKGNSYFFYHTGWLPGGGGFTRSTAVEQFEYNADGTIPQLNMTKAGVSSIGTLNPYTRTEGETIAWAEWLKTSESSKVGIYVTKIDNNDFIKIRDVDFGSIGTGIFTANVSSGSNGGTIELRIDALDGDIIGTLPVSYTGGWDEWVTKTINVNRTTGIHDLYLIFKGSELDEELFNLDYWVFSEKTTTKDLTAINATTNKFKIDKTAGVNTINYSVIAVYSDGTSEDITADAILTPAQTGLVAINNGTITGINYGEADITVNYGGQSDVIKVLIKDIMTEITLKSLSIDIENASDIKMIRGNSLPYRITAEYADGHTVNVTDVAIYNNSNSNVAEVANGTIKALSDGTAKVTVNFQDEPGNNLTVDININVETFPLTLSGGFNPFIWPEYNEQGKYPNDIIPSYDDETRTLITGLYGFAGWWYNNSIDLSNYKYLVVELQKAQTAGAELKLFDENSYWAAPAIYPFGNKLKSVIDLANMTKSVNGQTVKCDASNLYIIGFWSFGGSPIKIDRIFLSNDGQNPSGINNLTVNSGENSIVDVFSMMGVKVRSKVKYSEAIKGLSSGIYIVDGKKILQYKK